MAAVVKEEAAHVTSQCGAYYQVRDHEAEAEMIARGDTGEV